MKYPNPTFFWKLITRPFQICQIYKGSASFSFVKTPGKLKKLISFNLNFAFFHGFSGLFPLFHPFHAKQYDFMIHQIVAIDMDNNIFFAVLYLHEFCINICEIVCWYLILLLFINIGYTTRLSPCRYLSYTASAWLSESGGRYLKSGGRML